MNARQLAELLLLAAIWGASFLMMRLGAGDFGAAAMACLRVALASAVLLPIVVHLGQAKALRTHWKPLLLVGLLNSALPFLAYAYAASHITAGLASVFNATTPLWSAAIAWLWLKDRLDGSRIIGLVLGFCGVFWLVFDKTGLGGDTVPISQATAVWACLGATLCYGFSANFTKRYLTGVPPMASAAGSQLGAWVFLLVPGWSMWPVQSAGLVAWLSMVVLGVVCTGLAYLLYFRLIADVGPAKAVSVTFLIPAFAVLWGALFLGERVTMEMVGACLVIVAGTALATGLVKLGRHGKPGALSAGDPPHHS
jgi:drug/metabolite transporter (DMT)-like permease